MIRIRYRSLPAKVTTKLAEYQAAVDAAAGFPARVIKAKTLFKQRNTLSNPAFREVRRILDEMCSGARRCCYCEDSVADEVEHIRPKNWYPERAFVWANYLYACGSCNGPKSNRYAIFHARHKRVVELARGNGGIVQKPPRGRPLLINPRIEDPLDFLELDLRDTFWFLARQNLLVRDAKRADYTVNKVLKLNDRDYLVKARRNAFGTYCARLSDYILKKNAGSPPAKLALLIADLRQVPHSTVWAEMKRQRADHLELQRLFQQAPEALGW